MAKHDKAFRGMKFELQQSGQLEDRLKLHPPLLICLPPHRRVQTTSSTGTTDSFRVRLNLQIRVKKASFPSTFTFRGDEIGGLVPEQVINRDASVMILLTDILLNICGPVILNECHRIKRDLARSPEFDGDATNKRNGDERKRLC